MSHACVVTILIVGQDQHDVGGWCIRSESWRRERQNTQYYGAQCLCLRDSDHVNVLKEVLLVYVLEPLLQPGQGVGLFLADER